MQRRHDLKISLLIAKRNVVKVWINYVTYWRYKVVWKHVALTSNKLLCFTGVVLKIVTNTDRKIIHFILRVWLIVGYWFIGSLLYRAYEHGYVVTKSGRAHLNESPFLFWFTVSIQLALIGLFTYLFFKKPNLDKVGE